MTNGETLRNGKTTTNRLPKANPNLETSTAGASAISAVPKQVGSDFPIPLALIEGEEVVWNDDDALISNYVNIGRRLAPANDIYRRPGYASGLLMASDIATISIDTGSRLAPIIADRIRVRFVKNGNTRGNHIPIHDLNIMLGCEAFLQCFRPLDELTKVPLYLPNFDLMRRGYNDGGLGQRILYTGTDDKIEHGMDAVNAFLRVMAFATNADASNAEGLALTVMLRNLWPGAKPVGIVTSSKSHGGKETVIAFAAGNTPKLSIDYERADWAFRQGFLAGLKAFPEAGVVTLENARLGTRDKFIASAFLERFLTDPEPILHSSKARDALKIANHLVMTISTNTGTVSEDLMNRALPIHLNPVGNVADRESPIGNPKLEFLPRNRAKIEAELRGMVERWKAAGKPLDMTVKHPFTDWARTIGGILMVSGFQEFLGNYSVRRTADDPLRRGLGLLGGARPNQWLRADDWARLALSLGLVKQVIPEHDRETDTSRERGIGVVLSAHRDETFEVDTDDVKLTLALEKKRRRLDGQEPATRYQFAIVKTQPLPEA